MNKNDEDNDDGDDDGSGRLPSSFGDVVDAAECLLNLSNINNNSTSSMGTSSTGGGHPPPPSSSSSSSSSFLPYDNSSRSSTYINDMSHFSGETNEEDDYGPVRECRHQLTSLSLTGDTGGQQLSSRQRSDDSRQPQHLSSASDFVRPQQQPTPWYQDLTFTSRTGWRYQPPQHSLDRLGSQRRRNDYDPIKSSIMSSFPPLPRQQQQNSTGPTSKMDLRGNEGKEGGGNSSGGDEEIKNQAIGTHKNDNMNKVPANKKVHCDDRSDKQREDTTVVTKSTKGSTLTSTSIPATTTTTVSSSKIDTSLKTKEENNSEASDSRLTPKAALHKYYTQMNKDPKYKNSKNKIRITSESNFLTFDDGTPGQPRYTCIFLCPITNEAFLAGPLRLGPGGPSHHDYTTEKIDLVGDDTSSRSDEAVVEAVGIFNDVKMKTNPSLTLYWYSRKATAEHAASACAWDCFMKRQGKSRKFQLGEGHPYHPQYKPMFPQHPRIPSNVWKRLPEEQRMAPLNITEKEVDTDEGTESSDSLPPSKKSKTSSTTDTNTVNQLKLEDRGRSKRENSRRSRSRRRRSKSTDARHSRQPHLPAQGYQNLHNQSYANPPQRYPPLVPTVNHPLQQPDQQQQQQQRPPPPPPPSQNQRPPSFPPSHTSQATLPYQYHNRVNYLVPGQYHQPLGQIPSQREDFDHYHRECPQQQQQPNRHQRNARHPPPGASQGPKYGGYQR